MEQQQPQQLPQVQQNVLPALNAGKIMEVYTSISERSKRAVLALSQVKTIESDEDDAKANELLVKARVTLEGNANVVGVVDARKQITGELDAFKAQMMEPEKAIITEVDRLKGLRNKRANDVLRQQNEERERIEKEKQKNNEVARVKAAMLSNITNGLFSFITAMNNGIREHVNKMTLDNWDEMAKRFNLKPALQPAKYEALFDVEYNAGLITPDMLAAIKTQVQAEQPFEKVNEEYVREATGTIKMWADDLPNIKQRLEQIAETAKTDAIAAQKEKDRLEAERQKQADAEAERLQQMQQAQEEKVRQEQDEQVLQNEFAAQVEQQSGGNALAKGTRKKRVAVINCADADIVKTLSRVLYSCYSNPKFTGHLKRDKKGVVAGLDANGVPQYADWAQTLLDFVAKEEHGAIEGIEWREVVSTTAKK